MKVIPLAGFLILSAMGDTKADGLTAGDLQQLCTSKIQIADQTCGSWISGFLAGIAMTREAPKSITPVALRRRPTSAQARLIIENFLRKSPGSLDLLAPAVAYGALGLAYPCPPSRKLNWDTTKPPCHKTGG